MAYVAALVFASVNSFLRKKTCIMEGYGIFCFSFFLAMLRKLFVIFAEYSIFSKNYCTDYKKWYHWKTRLLFYVTAYFASLCSLTHVLRPLKVLVGGSNKPSSDIV